MRSLQAILALIFAATSSCNSEDKKSPAPAAAQAKPTATGQPKEEVGAGARVITTLGEPWIRKNQPSSTWCDDDISQLRCGAASAFVSSKRLAHEQAVSLASDAMFQAITIARDPSKPPISKEVFSQMLQPRESHWHWQEFAIGNGQTEVIGFVGTDGGGQTT